MWIATRFGFFSIVKDASTNHPTWMVRARVREDIENVCNLLSVSHSEIIISDESDYKYRILINLPNLEELMKNFAFSIDYPNFKDMIEVTQGQKEKIDFYTQVWHLFAEKFGTGLWNRALGKAFNYKYNPYRD